MLVLLSSESDDRAAVEVVAQELRCAGFTVQPLGQAVVCSTIEAIALAAGRVDCVCIIRALQGGPAGIAPSGAVLPDTTVIRHIRALNESYVFRGGVLARSTPIVLVDRPASLSPYGLHWRHVPPYYGGEFPRWVYISFGEQDRSASVADAIRDWRNDLLAELDYVGFTVTLDETGRPQISHALQRKRRDSELLAPNSSPTALREGQYLLLAEDALNAYGVYGEFKFLLQHYEQIAARDKIRVCQSITDYFAFGVVGWMV